MSVYKVEYTLNLLCKVQQFIVRCVKLTKSLSLIQHHYNITTRRILDKGQEYRY